MACLRRKKGVRFRGEGEEGTGDDLPIDIRPSAGGWPLPLSLPVNQGGTPPGGTLSPSPQPVRLISGIKNHTNSRRADPIKPGGETSAGGVPRPRGLTLLITNYYDRRGQLFRYSFLIFCCLGNASGLFPADGPNSIQSFYSISPSSSLCLWQKLIIHL